jgi:hypothetical protein
VSGGARRIDRSGWPPGPWDNEPDRIEWRTAVGLPGLLLRNRFGAWCGYVAVPPGHPCYGLDYESIYPKGPDGEPDYSVRPLPNPVHELSVHGGVTYGNACDTASGICHVPEPGEPDDVWWFGFDCIHSGDVMPSTLRYAPALSGDVYRDVAYVRAECEELAEQLTRVA